MQAVPTADGEEEGEGEGEMAGGGGEEVVEAGRGREQESEGASERGREESAQALLLKLYLSASPSSISLLGCSQLPSLARFVNEHGALFAEKTLHLTLVGEVKEASLAEEAEAILPANGSEEAFAFLLSEGQRLGVRMQIVTGGAVCASSMPSFFLEELAATCHPIAIQMRNALLSQMASLWHRASLPPSHPERQGLADECDRVWFGDRFCGGQDVSRLQLDDPTKIWAHLTSLASDGPLTLLVACPATLELFFQAHDEDEVCPSTLALLVQVNAKQLRSFLMDAYLYSFHATRESTLHSQEVSARRSMGMRWKMHNYAQYIRSLSEADTAISPHNLQRRTTSM
ncbi:MAG: hypothetical protein SGPRY_014897 [Prymnesium sp.]